ncbi:MAG: hypothetical protein JWN14_1232, partial [Chthonomonadales bacterium]|nr:hypothetical protein [Chthonomonadales bacterium]
MLKHLLNPAKLQHTTVFAVVFGALYMLTGCGGGGSTPAQRTAKLTLAVSWGPRTRELSAPSSALSAIVILKNAAPAGGDFQFSPTINRDPVRIDANTTNLVSTNDVKVGTWPLHVEFHAQANGEGDTVGVVDTTVTINSNGSGIGTLATNGAVGSVVLDANQSIYVGGVKDLTYKVYDKSTPPKLLSITPGSAQFSVISGGNVLGATPSGTATGFAEGAAQVALSIDGIQSVPQTVMASIAGGGVLSSASVAANDGSNAPLVILDGTLPIAGADSAPQLLGSSTTVVRGGSFYLSVTTPTQVDHLYFGIAGSPGYMRADVNATAANRSVSAAPPPSRPVALGSAPCPTGGCAAEGTATKYPVLHSRSVGRATPGYTYQTLITVPTGLNLPNFDVQACYDTGGQFSAVATNHITVNQTAQSSNSLQFTLSWTAPCDMDLHVTTPEGEEIGFDHRSSNSGGQLDLDSNPACRIDNVDNENITWSTAAPLGTYVIRPNLWSNCSLSTPIPYVITVNSNGSTTRYTGSFQPTEANRNSGTDPSHIIQFSNVLQNQRDLARVIMSEASVGNTAERTAVGWTVLTRMHRNNVANVSDVWGGY